MQSVNDKQVARTRPPADGSLANIRRQLQGCGCEVVTHSQSDTILSGAALTLSAHALSVDEPGDSNDYLRDIAGAVCRSVRSGEAVTLMISDMAATGDPAAALEILCARLREAGVPSSELVGTCLCDPVLPLRAYALITRCYLGEGPRYIVTQRCHGKRLADTDWDYIWRHRGNRWSVWPAYGDTVTTHCPLLCDESADSVLAPLGLHAPAGSRWLCMRLRLQRYADEDGDINVPALEQALTSSVDCGEQLLNELQLTSNDPDLLLNRRMAIEVSGFGEIVRMRRVCPSGLDVLESLLELTQHIRTTLWNRSREIARVSEQLPAIRQAHPMPASNAVDCPWSERWQAAVDRTAVRHRNLLVISPYAVLPRTSDERDGDRATYTDLLPLIGLADAHSFSDPPPFDGWNLLNFKRFHRRAKAVIQRRSDVSVVATRV